MKQNLDGGTPVTIVSGSSVSGLYAADGSVNAVFASGLVPCGMYHPSGALNVTSGSGVGIYAPDGSLYVRTNLILQSQNFSDFNWTKSHNVATVAVTNSSVVTPNGTASGTTITAGANAGYHYAGQSFTFTANPYLYSFYVQYNNSPWIFFTVDDSQISYFNVQTGVLGSLGTGVTASIAALANGWYRISAARTETAGAATGAGIGIAQSNGVATFTAAGTEAINVWGAQLELGPVPTSYIPTTTAAVSYLRYNV